MEKIHEDTTASTGSGGMSPKMKKIIRVALILSVATVIEFVFAFTLSTGVLKVAIFIALTILKAFYIVAEFMHLGHERRGLVYSVLMPMVFVLFLIFICLYELGSR